MINYEHYFGSCVGYFNQHEEDGRNVVQQESLGTCNVLENGRHPQSDMVVWRVIYSLNAPVKVTKDISSFSESGRQVYLCHFSQFLENFSTEICWLHDQTLSIDNFRMGRKNKIYHCCYEEKNTQNNRKKVLRLLTMNTIEILRKWIIMIIKNLHSRPSHIHSLTSLSIYWTVLFGIVRKNDTEFSQNFCGKFGIFLNS